MVYFAVERCVFESPVEIANGLVQFTPLERYCAAVLPPAAVLAGWFGHLVQALCGSIELGASEIAFGRGEHGFMVVGPFAQDRIEFGDRFGDLACVEQIGR